MWENIQFIWAVVHGLGDQFFPTAIVAALVTWLFLYLKEQSYVNPGKWTVGLLIVLVLWAFFPRGLHWISPPITPPQLGGIHDALPNYGAKLVADIILTTLAAILVNLIWDRR
jgi:MFS superfamily sulfate permease-like transporter